MRRGVSIDTSTACGKLQERVHSACVVMEALTRSEVPDLDEVAGMVILAQQLLSNLNRMYDVLYDLAVSSENIGYERKRPLGEGEAR